MSNRLLYRGKRKTAPKKPALSETVIQQTVMKHLHSYGRKDAVYWAVPNGGKRNVIEAKRMKGEGVKAGIPDVHILFQSKLYCLEIKTEKGRLSPAQKAVGDQMRAAGAEVAVAKGLDACLAQLKSWAILN